MCLAYQKMPSDLFFQDMDPYEKLWLFYAWAAKNEIDVETLRAQAILIGSFSNPDMAKRMQKSINPDYQTTDEEFDKSSQAVLVDRNKQLKRITRGKKKPRLLK